MSRNSRLAVAAALATAKRSSSFDRAARGQQYQCAWPLPKDTCASPRDSTASCRRDVFHTKRCTMTITSAFLGLRLRAAKIRVRVHTVNVNVNFPRRNLILIHVHLNGAP